MTNKKPVVILMADDDADDRMLTKEALEESRVVNDLRFVEDGEELLDYLLHRGRFAAEGASPKPGLILIDLNMPKKRRPGSPKRDQSLSGAAPYPDRGDDHVKSRRGYLSKL